MDKDKLKVVQDNNNNRITELIYELNDCREDVRNNQNQILQVLVTGGTLLGILFGASYFDSSGSVTDARAIFLLSIFIIGTVISYILMLGIESVLRYYYIQNLEDRLHVLIPTANDDFEMKHHFLHWSGFSGPVITRNPKHITSGHTILYYFSYTIVVLCAIGFSGYLIFILFSKIESKEPFDYFVGIAAIIIIATAFLLFLLMSARAKKMVSSLEMVSQANLERRWQNRHQRETVKMYQEASEFGRLMRYFLYPKTSDPQKPVLIILGFIGGLAFINQHLPIGDIGEYIQTFEWEVIWPSVLKYIFRLVYVIFAFDILAYQARYQINDIRGIKEDHNRLLPEGKINDKQKAEYIKKSLIVASIKIILAAIMAVRGDSSIRVPLGICLLLLLISTIAYETVRKKQIVWAIYFVVGSGYPLRFFLGMLTAAPQALDNMPFSQLFFMIIAFWAYGSYSSIIAWANEVAEKIEQERAIAPRFPADYTKRHFMALQKNLKKRYEKAEKHKIKGRVLPLRECGKLSDPWSVAYIFALVSLWFVKVMYLFGLSVKGIWVLESIALLCFIVTILVKYKGILLLLSMSWIIAIIAGIWVFTKISTPLWYLFLCLLQIIFTATYFVLRYSIQIPPLNLSKILSLLIKLIIGDDAWKYLSQHKSD